MFYVRNWLKSIWLESSRYTCAQSQGLCYGNQGQLTAVLIQAGSQFSLKPCNLYGPWSRWSILADCYLTSHFCCVFTSTPKVFCLRATERSGKGICWLPIGREGEKTGHSVTCGGQPGNPQPAPYVTRGQRIRKCCFGQRGLWVEGLSA